MKAAILASLFFVMFQSSANAEATTTPTILKVSEVNFIDGLGVGSSIAYTQTYGSADACNAAKAIALAEVYPDIVVASMKRHVNATRIATCTPYY